MRSYILRDSEGYIVGEILRTLKNIPLYEIHYPKAEVEIFWPLTRRVGYMETLLFVYMWGGVAEARKFKEWVEEEEDGANR